MRLIDVDALVLELRELKLVKCTIKRDATPRNSIRWWQYQTLIWFIDALIKNLKDPDRVPTIDAEPVIRCKDCQHTGIAGRPPFMFRYCRHPKGLTAGMRETDFCPYGERRADHADD